MPDRHRPGYDAAYKRALRQADRQLRADHPNEWHRAFDAAWVEERVKLAGDP